MIDATFRTPIAFGGDCVACGRPAEKVRSIRIVQGFTALVFRHQRFVWVPVPFCGRCAFRRDLAAFTISPAAIVGAIVIGAVATSARASGLIPPALHLALIVLVLGWIILYANKGEHWLDSWLLGIRGVSFVNDGETVTLRFRDEQRAGHLIRSNTFSVPRPPPARSRA